MQKGRIFSCKVLWSCYRSTNLNSLSLLTKLPAFEIFIQFKMTQRVQKKQIYGGIMIKQNLNIYNSTILFLTILAIGQTIPLAAVSSGVPPIHPSIFATAASKTFNVLRSIKNTLPTSTWISTGLLTATTAVAAWGYWYYRRQCSQLRIAHQQNVRERDTEHATALERLTQAHSASVEQLNRHYQQELEAARAQRAQANAANDENQRQLIEMRAQHEHAIAEINARHQQDRAAAEGRYRENIAMIDAERQQQLIGTRDETVRAIAQAQAAHRQEIDNLNAQYQQQITAIRNEHQAVTAQAQTAHQQEIAALQTQIAHLQAKANHLIDLSDFSRAQHQ